MEQTRTDCEKLETLIREFFEFESPTKLSEDLSLLLENYIVNAPVQKTDLGNMAFVVSRLTAFLFNLKALQNTETDSTFSGVLIDGETSCLHN